MNDTLLQISVDWLLIGRCLLALLWGILYAVFLQYHRLGQFLADERTWVSVFVGVGVDLLLGIGAEWWVIWLVIGCSAVGIVMRSLINERARAGLPSGYKVLWGLEDGIALSMELIEALEGVVGEVEGESARALSQSLRRANRINRLLRDARAGEYSGGR